jgi:putative flippase GtrA
MHRIHAIPQSVRFLVAGGFAALVNWLARFPLSLFLPFPAAVAAATAVGMCVGFVSYRHFVFPGSDRAVAHQLRDFVLINLVSMGIVTCVAVVFADVVLPRAGLVWHVEAIAHAIGIAVGAVVNFYAHRLISFRPSAPNGERPAANSVPSQHA